MGQHGHFVVGGTHGPKIYCIDEFHHLGLYSLLCPGTQVSIWCGVYMGLRAGQKRRVGKHGVDSHDIGIGIPHWA
jgi:hypothetical protein